MYSASAAFHQAVANGAHQIALLIFPDAVFTNDDLDISVGLEMSDYFNMEENLAIGQCLSNELSFMLYNDKRLLNDYEFGDFLATVGAQIGNSTVTVSGTVYANNGTHTYTAHNSSPYLKRDGTAVATQPGAKVTSILLYGGKVYCGLANGNVAVYQDSDGAKLNDTVNGFMKSQLAKWEGKGISYGDRILKIWKGTNLRTYEFVPWGYFTAERPNVPSVIRIEFRCTDYMTKFDKDMMTDDEMLVELKKTYPNRSAVYPLSFGDLFIALCNKVGVQYRTATFINSTATMSGRPDEFNNVTMREVLKWLAEAGASNARFDRDGYLVFDWLRSTSQSIAETNYKQINPYWYETKQVTKLYNRASTGGYEKTVGDGGEAYLIQDNPLLKGVS